MSRPLAVLALVALVACDDAAPSSADRLPRARCVIAVVASDYRSSSALSLLAADGAPCATDVVHSGSRPPGLLTALSGDVVLPSAAPSEADAEVVLIDRYPNGIVTRLSATDDDVRAQYAVAPGFPGNPQDVLRLDAATALVSRLERNPDAALDPSALDDGSDLLVIDWATGVATARIDLAAAADPGFDPMPTRLARAGERVWVGLTHLTPRFDDAGVGRVVAVDPEARAAREVVTLGDFVNCGNIAADHAGAGVWVVCSGLFRRGGAPQLAASGLGWIDTSTGALAWQAGARELDEGVAPLGFTLAPLDAERVLVVVIGDLDGARPDRLLLVDRTRGTSQRLLAAGAFELGAALPSPKANVVLVAVGDVRAPRIERLRLDTFAALAPVVDYSATGLPPRQVAFFR